MDDLPIELFGNNLLFLQNAVDIPNGNIGQAEVQEKDGEIADSGHADADRVGIAPEQIGQGIGTKKGSAEEKHFYNLLHACFRVPADCHDDGKQPAYKTAHQLNGSLGNF